jgi:hypothetical protein
MVRRIVLLVPLVLACCGGKSGPPELTGTGNPPLTAKQWRQMDEHVCTAFNAPPAEVQRCLDLFSAMSGGEQARSGSSRP